nr:hypothetical protein [Halorubrum sp. Ea1]
MRGHEGDLVGRDIERLAGQVVRRPVGLVGARLGDRHDAVQFRLEVGPDRLEHVGVAVREADQFVLLAQPV